MTVIDRTEVKRLQQRIAKAERRLARGIDVREEKLRGLISETKIRGDLLNVLERDRLIPKF